uniref:RNB domain-containing protein n=1 Tax=viral metagenome TaxID=1070528 RepID=A0A6C0KYV4_9ZZZZ|tara:strand:- start:12816 stop:14522 length:1707 start_codon:yes stop_codon:yes gene_type:complete
MYKFIGNNNYYEDYEIVETQTFQGVSLFENNSLVKTSKLFSNDTFDFKHNKIEIIHSHVRSCEHIPGVLSLNSSFGKYKDKLLYLCKPDDKRIPFFLVPYKIPYSFDKSVKKIYITFKYVQWEDAMPRGSMLQNFGDIEEVNNYYEYILYCKSLNVSIQPFTKEARKKLDNKTKEQIIQGIQNVYNIEQVTKKDEYIFTLDSNISHDHDDAISYNFQQHKITIYISNVSLVMEHLELWNSFTDRISTIYLPDKKRPMIPPVLIETLLSLDEKAERLCYALDIYYGDNNKVIKQDIKLCAAYISKNYSHDQIDLYGNNKYYQKITEILKIRNSKDIVTHLMIHFNKYLAEYLHSKNIGIYRHYHNSNNCNLIMSSEQNSEQLNDTKIPQSILFHISNFKTHSCRYCLLHESNESESVGGLYLQASSPIRRLVDVINNIALLKALLGENYELEGATQFYDFWTKPKQIEYINISSRTIRKVQSKCKIYSQYLYNKDNNVTQHYEGYVFDKLVKHDGKFQYMVFLPSLKLTTYITVLQNLDNYSRHLFQLFVFMNQEREKNKIKLQLCYVS